MRMVGPAIDPAPGGVGSTFVGPGRTMGPVGLVDFLNSKSVSGISSGMVSEGGLILRPSSGGGSSVVILMIGPSTGGGRLISFSRMRKAIKRNRATVTRPANGAPTIQRNNVIEHSFQVKAQALQATSEAWADAKEGAFRDARCEARPRANAYATVVAA